MSYLSDLLGEEYKTELTHDELSALLERVNTNRTEQETNKLKTALSKANSESAGYKKKLKELQENASSAESEQEKLKARIAELERKGLISENAAKYMQLGYDKDSAIEIVNAVLDKDFDKIMENHSKHFENQKKTIQSDLLKATPKPSGSGEAKQKSQAQKLEQKYFAEKYGIASEATGKE